MKTTTNVFAKYKRNILVLFLFGVSYIAARMFSDYVLGADFFLGEKADSSLPWIIFGFFITLTIFMLMVVAATYLYKFIRSHSCKSLKLKKN